MASVLQLSDVSIVRDGNPILKSVDWTVNGDERWVILGPNGAGKTTLLQVAAAMIHPSSGKARILDDTLGAVDVFELRPRIGFASTAMARRIPQNETVLDVVLTAAYSVTGRWNETYEDIDTRRAQRVLAEWRLGDLESRKFGDLSDGEQKRVQIARSVMTDPELLLGGYASAPQAPAIIMVTHHVEEIPVGFNRALLLSHGAITAAGPIGEVITSQNLSDTFGLPLEVEEINGRYTARAS